VTGQVPAPQASEAGAQVTEAKPQQQATQAQQQATQAPQQAPQQATQAQQESGPAVPEAAAAPAEAPVAQEARSQQPDDQPQVTVARADKPAQPQQAQQPQPTQQQPGDQQPQKQGADQRPADQPRGQAPVQQPAPAPAGPRPEHHVPAPAPQAQAPVTAPVGTPAPQAVSNAAPQALQRSVPLSRAAEAVENVIRLGSARGVTHARMSLRPAELGGIEIRLQQTGQGLVASVVADGVDAAQALQQAGADLRRQLEAHGIELQRLDISYSGDDRSGARSSEAQTGMGEGRSSGDTDSHATDGGDPTPTDDTTATSILELPDGVLVDVLA
jgi:flagellar hook-length control protein FliK